MPSPFRRAFVSASSSDEEHSSLAFVADLDRLTASPVHGIICVREGSFRGIIASQPLIFLHSGDGSADANNEAATRTQAEQRREVRNGSNLVLTCSKPSAREALSIVEVALVFSRSLSSCPAVAKATWGSRSSSPAELGCIALLRLSITRAYKLHVHAVINF